MLVVAACVAQGGCVSKTLPWRASARDESRTTNDQILRKISTDLDFTPKVQNLVLTIKIILRPEGFVLDKRTSYLLTYRYDYFCICAEPSCGR